MPNPLWSKLSYQGKRATMKSKSIKKSTKRKSNPKRRGGRKR